jgi:hypothetical protein
VLRVPAGEVERFGNACSGKSAEEELEGLGCFKDGLGSVVVCEGQAVVVGGSLADKGDDDFVGELGGERRMRKMFEGELD